MKILFCNYEYPPLGGGGGVINALLAAELAKKHDVSVLTSRAFDLPEVSIQDNVNILRVPVYFRRKLAAANMPSMLTYLPNGINAGRKLLRKERFDIINTHFVLPSGPVGDHLSRYGDLPNVVSVHGGDLYDPSKKMSPHRHWLLRAWIRKLLRNASSVVGQSNNTLQNMQRYYTPEICGTLIPLGIKRPIIQPVSRDNYGFSEHDILFITVGRLVGRKAIDQLINILAGIDNRTVHLLVLGSGPKENELKKLSSDLQLNDNIHFYGFTDEDEKYRLLGISDVFVSTSQHEGFGIVFLEAMACGLPVICYDHGGQTDFLENQKTGYLVKLNETEEFANACKSVIESDDERLNYKQENLDRIESLYIENCASQYENVFQDVIDKHRSGNIE